MLPLLTKIYTYITNKPRQKAKLYWKYPCLWKAMKEGHDMMQRKKPPLLTKSVNSYKISKSLFLHRNSYCCRSIFTSMVNILLMVSMITTSWSRVQNVKNWDKNIENSNISDHYPKKNCEKINILTLCWLQKKPIRQTN